MPNFRSKGGVSPSELHKLDLTFQNPEIQRERKNLPERERENNRMIKNQNDLEVLNSNGRNCLEVCINTISVRVEKGQFKAYNISKT